jgi:hypothetical protein
MHSAAERDLQEKAQSVPPGTLRHTVLLATKRFKSTWAELGKLLVQVRDEGKFEEWGYPSFEAYCLKELHLKRPTALKLTRSFSFLSRHEPRDVVQQEDFVQKAPDFEVVDVLADAEARGQLTPDEYRSVREQIWNPEKPASEVKRELAERFPRPAPAPPTDALQVRRLAQAARKLAEGLNSCRKVPRAVAERAQALADDVEEVASGLNTD